jgi:two-component system LytT family response regulator
MHELSMRLTTVIANGEPHVRSDLRVPRIERFDPNVVAQIEAPSLRPGAAPRTGTGCTRIIGEQAHRFHFLDAQAVDYFEVDGNYVTIHARGQQFLTRTTLKHLCDELAGDDFVRIDRSLLVNLRQVDYVERLEGGRFAFRLRSGQQLMSSRERASAIIKLLRSTLR